MLTHFTTSETYQTLDVLARNTQPKYTGIGDILNPNDTLVALSIDSAFLGLFPTCHAIHSDTIEIISNQHLLSLLVGFINGELKYPQYGKLTEFYGLTFKQIPRRYQRKLLETKIKLSVLACISDNQDKEDDFRQVVSGLMSV